ncbi:MAG: hypothetical protein V2A79_00735 [Planctomycetota bacterium]
MENEESMLLSASSFFSILHSPFSIRTVAAPMAVGTLDKDR